MLTYNWYVFFLPIVNRYQSLQVHFVINYWHYIICIACLFILWFPIGYFFMILILCIILKDIITLKSRVEQILSNTLVYIYLFLKSILVRITYKNDIENINGWFEEFYSRFLAFRSRLDSYWCF